MKIQKCFEFQKVCPLYNTAVICVYPGGDVKVGAPPSMSRHVVEIVDERCSSRQDLSPDPPFDLVVEALLVGAWWTAVRSAVYCSRSRMPVGG